MFLTRTGKPRRRTKGLTADEKLRFHGWTVTESGCWEWAGTIHPDYGYGAICHESVQYRVHRLAYETWVGPIPEGHVVRHKCDNRPCINPEHLETGTQVDNNRDTLMRGRKPLGSVISTSKLTEDGVREMRKDYSEHHQPLEVYAERYGVSRSTISRVLRGEAWHYVD